MGLYQKFNVSRRDGGSSRGKKHHGCRYFVIDVEHDQFAKLALRAYADAAAASHPQLAADMIVDYELGACPSTWRPLSEAPENTRVLLGPRDAPVVGVVIHPAPWEEDQDSHCHVVHYNGTTLVAGYHCSEWRAI